MTWCFNCKLDQKNDHLALCKELGHDIDSDHMFQITNHDVKKIKDTKETKENPARKLTKFATSEMIKVCISQSDPTRVYADVKMNDHFVTIELDKDNSRTKNWLRVRAYDKLNEMYSEETCASAIGFLKAKASMDEKIQSEEIHLRVAYVYDELYYDLGRADWKLLKISKNGISFVDYSKNTPMFIRTSKTAKQVEPNLRPDGNPLDEFVKLCKNPNPELFKVHLVTFFIEGLPMPIMAIRGHAGATKSTTSSMVKRIVDPSGKRNEDNLKSFPHGEDNFVTSLSSSYLSWYENISHIDRETSNMLCRAVTGSSFDKRAQYTNGDVFSISIKRKIGINGVDFTISQSDLADRTIQFDLERISDEQRKTSKSIEEEFRRLLPDILGQIFIILQKVLATIDEVEKQIKDKKRMADFLVYGEAIYQAMGHTQGEFQDLYENSIKKNLETLYDNNPIIPCLDNILGDETEVDLQANVLYSRIKSFVDEQGYNAQIIPKGSNGLYNWLTRSKTLLDDNNIIVIKYTNKQTKEKSGFHPNATIYNIKRITPKQTALDNELEL